MNTRICQCKKCGETDDFSTRTGACIDGVYHCETCYQAAMDQAEGIA